MDETIQQKIEARLAELPPDVQDAISSSDFDEKIQTIGKIHNLHVDQMEAVADEVMLAMLGFISMDDLPEGLKNQANLPPDQAHKVADAIANEIFVPIRESMKKWAEDKKNELKPVSAPPAVASPAPMPLSTPMVATPSYAPRPAPPAAIVSRPAPLAVQTPPKSPSAPVSAPLVKPAPIPNLAAADAMLSEKKIAPPASMSKPTPAPASAPAANTEPPPGSGQVKPQPYKADPYREPAE